MKGQKTKIRKDFIIVLIFYAIFCFISFLSRYIPSIFVLVIAFGLFFPLIWAKYTKSWDSLGFTRQNILQAIIWGTGTGLIIMVYTFIVFGNGQQVPMLQLQLLVGIPVWFLIMSPFQEFFFRGLMQPKIQNFTGKWAGLTLTSFLFTLWHFFPPLEGTLTSTLPLTSLPGILSTFILGMIWGYTFQRTNNIIAPWIAHALAGISLILIGRMVLVYYIP